MEQMEEFKTQLNDISDKVNKMLQALMGNELTKDGGLIRRIDTIEKRVEAIAKKQVKMEIYQKLLWAAAGAIMLSLVQYFFKVL